MNLESSQSQTVIVPNLTLFEVALADEYRTDVGSVALLAFRRFCRRSLKQLGQIGAGLLSLVLVVGIASHSPVSAETASAKTAPAKTMSMSVPYRLSDQPSNPSLNPTFDSKSRRLDGKPSIAPSAKGKPFQMLRPKMTYHRLTTSRFSIPAGNAQAVDPSERK